MQMSGLPFFICSSVNYFIFRMLDGPSLKMSRQTGVCIEDVRSLSLSPCTLSLQVHQGIREISSGLNSPEAVTSPA
ncbi:hypothetical protein EUGRSUZ_I02447 [Eucalyptus grandis]|uniref:Uncharacterized protein n=2 Tax=Eucalyptus grandis TaxID=71139 RepID=A0ACC3JIM5_EUCGR|nr:hypothetical protein EUGRSUZ_I02447 [Eucalyptus grandis]